MIKVEETELRNILDEEIRKHLYTPIASSPQVIQQTEQAIIEFINSVQTALSKQSS